MKRILVLTPRFPYPVVGGDKLRIYHICKELSKSYRLTLLSMCEKKEELFSPIPKDDVFEDVHRVYLPQKKSYLNCLLSIPTKTPLQVAYYRSSEFKKKYQELSVGKDYVLCHLLRTAAYCLEGKEVPVIAELTDSISLNYKRVSEVCGFFSLKSLIYRLEEKRLLSYERGVVHDFEISSFISSVDVDYLVGEKTPDNVVVSGNGVDVNKYPVVFSKGLCEKNSYTVVFVGNMLSLQNLDSARWFARNVLPILSERVDITFKVVGKISDNGMSVLCKYDNVEVTGAVDNISDHVHDVVLGVCPMRAGAGVQNKVLEYMSFGLPVVVSSIGAEGIYAVPGEDILVADEADEFADSVMKIINNPDLASALSVNARKFVEEHHSWSGCLSPLVNKIREFDGPHVCS